MTEHAARVGSNTVRDRWRDDEAIAFVDAVRSVPADRLTACRGWTAHDVVAHAVAGGAEIARLVGRHLAGEPDGPTTPFEDRESAFRAMAYDDLVALVSAGRILDLLAAMADASGDATLAFTGWAMNADTLAMHVRSELAIHRWDLVGSDPTSLELLAQPELTAHAVRALNRFGVIAERVEARTRALVRSGSGPIEARLRANGQPDVIVRATASATELVLAEPDSSPALTLDAAGRLLMLWGRTPPAVHRATTDLGTDTVRALQHWLYPSP